MKDNSKPLKEDKPDKPIKEVETKVVKKTKVKVPANDAYFSTVNYYNDFVSKKPHNRIFDISPEYKKSQCNKDCWAGLLIFLGGDPGWLDRCDNDSNQDIADTLLNNGAIKEYGRITEFKYLLGYLVNRGPFIFSEDGESFLVYGVNTEAETFFTTKGQVLFSVINKKIANTQNYGISTIVS
jgi:hypothetical protein